MRLRRGIRGDGFIQFFTERSNPRAELRAEVALAHLHLLEFGEQAVGGFIPRVGGDEGFDVRAERPAEFVDGVELIHRLAEQGAELLRFCFCAGFGQFALVEFLELIQKR